MDYPKIKKKKQQNRHIVYIKCTTSCVLRIAYHVMCSTYGVTYFGEVSSMGLRGDRAVFDNWAGTANTYTTRITGNLGTRAVHVELAPDYCPSKVCDGAPAICVPKRVPSKIALR